MTTTSTTKTTTITKETAIKRRRKEKQQKQQQWHPQKQLWKQCNSDEVDQAVRVAANSKACNFTYVPAYVHTFSCLEVKWRCILHSIVSSVIIKHVMAVVSGMSMYTGSLSYTIFILLTYMPYSGSTYCTNVCASQPII